MSNETADCGKADPDEVSKILDAMPDHYGADQRYDELLEYFEGRDGN